MILMHNEALSATVLKSSNWNGNSIKDAKKEKKPFSFVYH